MPRSGPLGKSLCERMRDGDCFMSIPSRTSKWTHSNYIAQFAFLSIPQKGITLRFRHLRRQLGSDPKNQESQRRQCMRVLGMPSFRGLTHTNDDQKGFRGECQVTHFMRPNLARGTTCQRRAGYLTICKTAGLESIANRGRIFQRDSRQEE
jgi:hypothetical protein